MHHCLVGTKQYIDHLCSRISRGRTSPRMGRAGWWATGWGNTMPRLPDLLHIASCSIASCHSSREPCTGSNWRGLLPRCRTTGSRHHLSKCQGPSSLRNRQMTKASHLCLACLPSLGYQRIHQHRGLFGSRHQHHRSPASHRLEEARPRCRQRHPFQVNRLGVHAIPRACESRPRAWG